MSRSEALRWLGSVGIFYVLIPAWVVVSAFLLPRCLPWLPNPEVPLALRIGGLLLALLGAVLAAVSIRTLVRAGQGHPFDLTGHERLSRPTRHLMTGGVYAWSRNPMGLGDLLLYAGIALGVGSVPSLVLNVPAYAVLVWWNHRFNERKGLIERFGDEWLAYEKATPWLLPGPGWFLRRARTRL